MTRRERARVKAAEMSLNLGELFLYVPFARRHKGIAKFRNERYAPQGRRALLDIYFKDTANGKPLFLYIHGGGFVSGLKNNRRFYCYNWVDKGYVAVNIDYDYALNARHPEHLRQIFKGVEYALDRVAELGADTDRIVVAGDSAGGYFAAMIAAAASHRGIYDYFGIEFKYRDTFTVAACVTVSAVVDPVRSVATGFPQIELFAKAFFDMSKAELKAAADSEFVRRSAPDFYADEKFPPTFVIGSSADKLLSESEIFKDKLAASGVMHGFYLCGGVSAVHAGGLACELSASGKEALEKAQKFAAEALEL